MAVHVLYFKVVLRWTSVYRRTVPKYHPEPATHDVVRDVARRLSQIGTTSAASLDDLAPALSELSHVAAA
eukprot:5147590-Prymnesium_polylepis.2